MTSAGPGFMFPGQGTQRAGMGRWIERASPAAKAVFALADDVLGRDVQRLCFAGPARELTLTQNAQVAIFTCNAAAAALLAEHDCTPSLALGHSVGELNALCVAGVLPFEEGLRLVATRGELMGRVRAEGTMAAVIGLSLETVEGLCAQVTEGPVVVALVNGPENLVVSGAVAAVARCEELASAAGARKVTRLVVSSAFHSPLMGEVADEWAAVVAAVPLAAPTIPVVLDATGAVATDVEDVRTALVGQLTTPVRWVDAIRSVRAAGVTSLVEAGDSKVLAALARHIEPEISTLSLNDPRSVRRLGSVAA